MTEVSSSTFTAPRTDARPYARTSLWLPTWGLITTRLLELRKRRGLMIAVVVLILALPVLVLGLRLIFHAVDPKSYGPAGSPGIFSGIVNTMAEFGFIAAATLGTAAGTSDLSDGMFRHLVVTGRSRLALYFARIPAGLAILIPALALAFSATCLVTSYAGVPQPTSLSYNGATIPVNLDQTQLRTWLDQNPEQGVSAFEGGPGPGATSPSVPAARAQLNRDFATIDGEYTSTELTSQNPAVNEMVKIGLWLLLEVSVAFLVGLGLGSLLGQRTVATILMIALEIIITPILADHVIPYFLDGQRLVVGIALDQLRPAGLGGSGAGPGGGGGPGHVLFGGRAVLGIPSMPTWAMITVIVGWIVGWTGIGAWRMATRDA